MLSSCSVLEDRNACPCMLVLDLDHECNEVCDSVQVRVSSESGFSYEVKLGREDYSKGLCVRVPTRNGVYISVLDRTVGLDYLGDGPAVRIPVGEQCPRTYMYTAFRQTSAEQCVDTVRIAKNFCGISMTFLTANMDRYGLVVKGDVCGYDAEGRPVSGLFEYEPQIGDPNGCYFRIPRQLSSSLRLSLKYDGRTVRDFAIGNMIEQSGYDWNASDLQDVFMTLDFAESVLTVSVNDWTIQEFFDIVI